MVDKTLIHRKLSLITEYVQHLKSMRLSRDGHELLEDFMLFTSVCYSLQMTIHACVDIASHLCSDEQWELPESYAHSIRILSDHNVIYTGVSQELQLATKLRNVIVHQYETVDTTILGSVVADKLWVFEQFSTELSAWLHKQKA